MTAVVPAPVHETGAFARIWRVVKLHFANPYPVLITPWMIMGIIFLANIVIWWIIRTAVTAPEDAADAVDGFQYSGASFYIFVYMLVVAVLAMNASFAYALGFSSTRRDYFLGTALTFVILAAIYSAGFGVLGLIERATNGWGLGGRMFTAIYFGDHPLVQLFATFALFLFFFFIGAVAGAVFVRFRSTGVITFFAILALILIGGAALFTLTGSWGSFAQFFVDAGFVGSYAWSLVPTAIFAVIAFFTIRRATPRS